MVQNESAVAQKVADLADPPAEQPNDPDQLATDPVVRLTISGRAAVTVRVTEEAWRLDDTVIVVPVSPQGQLGEFGRQVDMVYAGVDSAIASAVSALSDGLRCDEVIDVAVGSGDAVLRVIATTAHDAPADRFTVAGAGRAALAVVRRADRMGVRRLAIPLIGTGGGQLDAESVARVMLNAVVAARPQRIGEVTFVVRDDTAAQLFQSVVRTRGQRLANDLPKGADQLNVEAEVTALAEMLMMEDVEPPLVVGVLGGWGSGKSFIMHLLRKRMAELRSLPVHDRFPYVGHVYPVRFDAWTYAKTDLWASLLQSIFRQVSTHVELERRIDGGPDGARIGNPVWSELLADQTPEDLERLCSSPSGVSFFVKDIADDKTPGQRLWQALERARQHEQAKLEALEGKAAELRARLARARRGVQESVEADIAKEARRAAWMPVQTAVRHLLGESADRFREYIERVTEQEVPTEDPRTWRLRDLWHMVRRHPGESFAFALLVVLGAVGPFVLSAVDAQLEVLKLPGLTVATLGAVIAAWRKMAEWHEAVNASFEKFRAEVDAQRANLEAGREERIKQRIEEQRRLFEATGEPTTTVTDSVPALEAELDRITAQAVRQRQQVGLTAGARSLPDFLHTRLEERRYEERLGFMHQVQDDLQELSESLFLARARADQNDVDPLFPRGDPRVVLFIDDLDRCPPKRVVEVLEATQLLVKTRLFVVVLAIDVRYVTLALEKEYSDILVRHGDPSGLDYIEKIIQIPYGVRPVARDATRSYLAHQMLVDQEQGEAPVVTGNGSGDPTTVLAAGGGGPTPPGQPLPDSVVRFTAEELNDLVGCCETVELSPRTMKRLVNIYKLLKIFWYRSPAPKPGREVERGILALLTLSARYRQLMRGVFENLAALPELRWDIAFRDFFVSCRSRVSPSCLEECKRMIRDSEQLLPTDLSIRGFGIETLEQVRSFSFVGDIGYHPGDDGRVWSRRFRLSEEIPRVAGRADLPQRPLGEEWD
jgi:hypothetical protein